MANQRSEVNYGDSIRATLEAFDPENRCVLVGSDALYWVLNDRGFVAESMMQMPDIDVLTTQEILVDMRASIDPNKVSYIRLDNRRLEISPSSVLAESGVLPFDAMSDSDYYDDPLVFTKFDKIIYADDANFKRLVVETHGIRHLDLPFLFWWKSAVGRPSDITLLGRI